MYRLLTCGVLALLTLGQPALAQQVLVTPGSVILGDRQRSAQFFVANTTGVTNTYSLEPAFFQMEPDGRLVEVPEPFPANSAGELIRFSPRQFELAPGTTQSVRVAIRLPEALPAGEYRVHLRITNRGATQFEPKVAAQDDDAAAVVVRIRVSRAVRILVRHDVGAGRATLAEVSARHAGGGNIHVSSALARSGEGSSKGSYRVYTRSGGAERDELLSRGVLIYSELPRRTVEDTIPASAVHGGVEVCVAYRDETAGDGGEEERCVRPG